MRAGVGLAVAALARCAVAGWPRACKGDLCCSLNGRLQDDGACLCDRPWSGPRCEVMNFRPVAFPQGYGMAPNLTSWGGHVLFDGSMYHLFVATMTNGCPLATWGTNSRIDHATSSSIEGPYAFADAAIPTWSHNPAPVALRDGTFAIFHIGDGAGAVDGGRVCARSAGEAGPRPGVAEAATTAHPNSIHVSASLSGPWTPLRNNTLGHCNNPAPWVHPNGTIFLVCNHNKLLRAESVSGPWAEVGSIDSSGGHPGVTYEDPFLYTDARGNFHVLLHAYEKLPAWTCTNSTVSAHAFSVDGFAWTFSPVQPYTTQVRLATGETITVSTRERPKLFFDGAGRMTHLVNGVCSAEACPPPLGPKVGCVDCKYKHWDYTLVAPLDLGAEEEEEDEQLPLSV